MIEYIIIKEKKKKNCKNKIVKPSTQCSNTKHYWLAGWGDTQREQKKVTC